MQTTKPKTSPKPSSSTTNPKPLNLSKSQTQTKPKSSSTSEPSPAAAPPVEVDRRTDHSSLYKWSLPNFLKLKAKSLHSPYFQVGGFDFRFMLYPKGDSLALPGYFSLYLQIIDPKSPKFDCFAYYRLTALNHIDNSKSLYRESNYRFSNKKKSVGWSDFLVFKSISDPKLGFLVDGTLVIQADIRVLDETVSFLKDNEVLSASESSNCSVVLNGKLNWKINNYGLFKEMLKTQKILGPFFQIGEFNFRISVYRAVVNKIEYLSLFLETANFDKCNPTHRGCWCMFRISVLNQKPGLNHVHRDSYGRFSVDCCDGNDPSLGWREYMKMSDFIGKDKGFLVDDSVVLSVSFHAIKESTLNFKVGWLVGGKSSNVGKKCDEYMGKLVWNIEHFSKLKDLLKKKKLTGVFIKSQEFKVGNQEFRLVVYPRGQSQKPCHLSLFLEVLDPQNTSSDWSSFVYYELSIVNRKIRDKSIKKESQGRCSKATKDWGWCEFMTLTSLFDQDSGFLVDDTAVFSAEVRILKETFLIQDSSELSNRAFPIDSGMKKGSFTWKVENFLSFKEILSTQRIYSKFFQFGGCELRMGVYESFDTICAFLECDPSVVNDLDKNFWVSYRMAMVNQKDTAKSLWKESSLCTKSSNSVLHFMKVSDMLEAGAGFLVREMVVFVCEILDYCPWFEFSDLEVLASDDNQDACLTLLNELLDFGDSGLINENKIGTLRDLFASAGCHLRDEDSSLQPLDTLKEEVLGDVGVLTRVLVKLRFYITDPVKIKQLLCQTKFSSNNDRKQENITTNESLPSQKLIAGIKALQQIIDDALLHIMVECCQPSEGYFNEDSYDASSQSSPDTNKAVCQSEFNREYRAAVSGQSIIKARLSSVMDATVTCAVPCSSVKKHDIPEKVVHGQHISPPETSAEAPMNFSSLQASKTKWPESSEELLALIVNSLKAHCPEPRQRPLSAEKISIVLDKAPKHLQPDLVTLVPKLVNQSEHPLAACTLLDRLQKPDADPALRSHIFTAISQLDFGNEVCDRILFQAPEHLVNSNDETLGPAIGLLFKAACRCQHIPQAVKVVLERLESLGKEVLDFLSKTVNSWGEIAEAMLREIELVFKLDDKYLTNPSGPSLYDESELATKSLHLVDDQHLCAYRYFFHIYFLIEMLSIPSLAVEASQAFKKGVAKGYIVDHSVAMVLERRCTQKSNVEPISFAEKNQQKNVAGEGNMESMRVQEVNFTLLLGLAENLSLSSNSQVQEFLRLFYVILIRLFADESYHRMMLKGLVNRVTSPANNFCERDLDILVFLVHGEHGIARPVLSMMREVAELANVDCAALRNRLCASEDESIHAMEERQAELSNMDKGKAILLERLSESEAAIVHLKSEMRCQVDHFTREKKELSKQRKEVKSQLECFRSQQGDEIAKLSMEKKVYQDRLYDVETQLSQLKSKKNDELKKVVKEKNTLAEKLISAEADRKRFDEELKQYATEAANREVVRQSLLDEVWRLKQKVEQTEGEKQEIEEEVARCRLYVDGIETKLSSCQQCIQSLEVSLQDEMLQHAPLYGAGLQHLSAKELETLSCIHEEGLRNICALLCWRRSPGADHLSSASTLQNFNRVQPTGPPPVGLLPTSVIPNVSQIHNNSAAGPWFNHKH